MLRHAGYAGLSTGEVAAEAGVPLSQIHYHFGSSRTWSLQLFEYLNDQLLDRQNKLFGDPSPKLSEQWGGAYDYLDEDIASGYVWRLQELIAVSWHDAEVAKVIRAGIMGWVDLIVGLGKGGRTKDRPARPLCGGSRRDRGLQLDRGESLFLLGLERKARRYGRRFAASAI